MENPLTPEAQKKLDAVNAAMADLRSAVEAAEGAGVSVLIQGRAEGKHWACRPASLDEFELVARYEALTAAACIVPPKRAA